MHAVMLSNKGLALKVDFKVSPLFQVFISKKARKGHPIELGINLQLHWMVHTAAHRCPG